MRLTLLIAIWTAIGGPPLAALLLMTLTGAAEQAPALVAAAAVAVVSLSTAWIATSDISRLAAAVRRALAGASDPPVEPPSLPPLAAISHDIEGLSRALIERGLLVGRLMKADAAIVERLPDPLIVLAADRSVRRANAAARAAFGADMSAVLRHPGLRAAIDRAYATSTPQSAELSLQAPIPREVQASVITLDPPLADGGQAMVVLSDRTRERAVERMRADFVANSSHELRTPLASLIGFIETLRGPAADDPPAQARFLTIMAEQAERMNRLIDDLLSLSRIELIEHQPPADAVDLADLVAGIAAGFEPRVKQRRISLQLSLPEGLPEVVGDADQLAQVVQNLLDNAVKYGREGGSVRVVARLPPQGARWPARPGLVFSVADDGQGIAREHVPRLTERFYRVDKGRSRSVGGTGLGLAIVKHIVNRHRGQLRIESEEGHGSIFQIWLPTVETR
jgi:two-component system phosphate regulon sensor histidine kinase PhoR